MRGADETQVKMIRSGEIREVKWNSIHKETGFQSKTGTDKQETRNKRYQEISQTPHKKHNTKLRL